MPDKLPPAPLTRSKWSFDELNGKSVEFHLTYREGTVANTGRFLIRRVEGESMAVEIDWTEVDTVRLVGRYQYYPLYQRHVDQIEQHPEAGQPCKPAFRVLA